MSLLDVVLVTESLIEHSSHLLNRLKIVMSKYMGQVDHKFSSITNDFAEELFLFVSKNLDYWRIYKREKSIHHRDVWKSRARSAEESASLICVV